MIISIFGIPMAGLILVLSFMVIDLRTLNSRQEAINEKLDAIPDMLAEEFRVMRGEMADQTSAIIKSTAVAR
ncbi:MAG: hypothetical protein ACKV2V_18020 [Blastocatellia bacterium]